MGKFLSNPFRFGDPVEGEYYLERPELKKLIMHFLTNRAHVVLIGPRRFGKTSFLLNLLRELEKQSFDYVFVDIFNITSHRDFLHQILRALKTKENWKEFLRSLISSILRLRPKASFQVDEHTGRSSLELLLDSHESEKDVKELIQDVLSGLSKMGKKLIFAIDEFQKISEIRDEGWLEGTLRTHMQQLKNVSFIFTGSRRSVIFDMLNNPSRPLYKFCQPLEFPVFGDEFTDWILGRFKEVHIKCSREAIVHLRGLVQNTPNYVQMVCFHLVALGKTDINIQEVNNALKIVVQQNAYAYQTLLNSLTPIQQRVLRLIAIEGKQIFSKDLLKRYEISSSAALSSALKSLKDKEILDEDRGKGTAIFDDPLFSIWLKTSFDD